MDYFNYKDGRLYAEAVALSELAQQYGTPCYVYSRATLERHWRAFDQALSEREHLICYAVKANANLAVLNILARLGSGFDIVSVGELERVVKAGGDPRKIVFSGVGKRKDEMLRALQLGIHCFNVESKQELEALDQVAGERQQVAPISIRVNPDVDAKTHPYISTGLKENKFGINIDEALQVYRFAAKRKNLKIIGIDCHIGSQLTDNEPFIHALDRLLLLVDTLAQEGIDLQHLDLGGGLGIRYDNESPPLPSDFAKAINKRLHGRSEQIILEPGRAIAGNAGILLTRVEYIKDNGGKHFAIVDAAMNDLLRPALYDAWQAIIPVEQNSEQSPQRYDIVGPVCESSDFLGKSRTLALQAGDLLAVRSSGAYGFAMSSNYNTRPRAAEIMVDGDKAVCVRKRETIDQMLENECILED